MLVIFWLLVPGPLKCILAKFELISITIWSSQKYLEYFADCDYHQMNFKFKYFEFHIDDMLYK